MQYLVAAYDGSNQAYEQELFGVPLGAGLSRTVSQGGSSASMSVTPGMLRLRAESAWPASNEGTYGAQANITLTDNFVLTAPPGSSVFLARLSATISVSGSLAQSGGGASWRSTALLSASPYRGPEFSLVTPWSEADVSGAETADFGNFGTPLPTTFTTATPAVSGYTDVFIVGQPVAVRLTFSASADRSDSTSAGFARASLEDTLIWLGITARDENGNIIEGLSFVSESGTDWGNPPAVVPLPATVWLLLAGIGALGTRIRRRG